MNSRRVFCLMGYLIVGIALFILGGCASAKVSQTKSTPGALPRPDMVVVFDFAVTSAEIKLDQGLMQKAMRDDSSRSLSTEENQVGHLVANKLADELVKELRKEGIAAVRPGSQLSPSRTTGFLTGQFVTIDQGNQTQRNMIGFGLGGTELRTRIQLSQEGQLVAEAETSTKSSLKPGMLVSAGAAGAAQSVVPLVVGGAAVVVSEKFTATVEADASRTAKEIVKRMKNAYQARGWLP
jgi:Domain of unknown function (DUF4410)